MDRRTFTKITLGGAAAVGIGAVSVPFIKSLSRTEDKYLGVDLSEIGPGEHRIVKWSGLGGAPWEEMGGAPIFILHRTAEMLGFADQSREFSKNPESKGSKVLKKQWLIVKPICTHLGCRLYWEPDRVLRDSFTGTPSATPFACRCHGAVFDYAGRPHGGPAAKNLLVPAYTFVSEHEIALGRRT